MTSPPKSRKPGRYHHGDLPRALVEAALALVEAEGVSALTLREVARRVEVTHAAPYRHFKDKSALLAAVAEEGFKRLAQALVAARSAPSTDDRRTAMGIAYLRFAIEHPAHYRLMFGVEAETAGTDGLRAAAAELLAAVQQSGGAAPPAPVGGDSAPTSAWAEWHGLALLHLGGWLIQPDRPSMPQLLARAIAAATSPTPESVAPVVEPAHGIADEPVVEPTEPEANVPDGGARRTSSDS